VDAYDWRQHRRKEFAGSIDVTISVIESSSIKMITFSAEVVDVSRGGIGIISEIPLESGYVRLGGTEVRRTGNVMWNQKLDDERYRIGIRFDQLFATTGFSRCDFITVDNMDADANLVLLDPQMIHPPIRK
jgi:hypothetical protein